MNHLGARARGYGLLMPALMEVHSSGRVLLVDPDPHMPPHVEFRMLSDPADVAALVRGVELTLTLLRHPAFEAIVTSAYIDDRGTTIDALDSPGTNRRVSFGRVSGITCTCGARAGWVVVDDTVVSTVTPDCSCATHRCSPTFRPSTPTSRP